MISLFDLLLYDPVHAHQQELLQSARVSRMLRQAETPSTGRVLRAWWERFKRRVASRHSGPLESSFHARCHDRSSCHCLRARKTAA